MGGYYFCNPHGHTTRGIQWDGLNRDEEELSLQEVVNAARKEFKDVPFEKLFLFPGANGSFSLGVSDRSSDQNLKTLADLINGIKEEEYENEDFNEYFIVAYEHGVFIEPEYPPES
ncbi:MAG: hypothetical protein WC459_01215 [Patescibacteria group bacterium]